jgi:hypothetical protein
VPQVPQVQLELLVQQAVELIMLNQLHQLHRLLEIDGSTLIQVLNLLILMMAILRNGLKQMQQE